MHYAVSEKRITDHLLAVISPVLIPLSATMLMSQVASG